MSQTLRMLRVALVGLIAALAGCDTPPVPEATATPFGEAVRPWDL